MDLLIFYINLVLFFIHLVLALLNKMAGLSINFVIFLMLFVLLLLPLLLLLSFRGKLLLLPFIPSISVILPLFIIKLLMICCLVLLPLMTYLESLDHERNKLQSHSRLCCFLGYGIGKKGYRCYDRISKSLHVSRHVVFWEQKMFYQLPHVPVSPISSIDPLPDLFLKESPTSISEHPPLISEFPPSISNVPSHASDEPPALIIDVPTDNIPAVDPADPSDSHALRRSHRVTTLPSHFRDFHCFSAPASLHEPQAFRETSSNPLWQQAMKQELDTLHKTGTWDLVDLPSEKSAIGCKWVYKVKTWSDGTVVPSHASDEPPAPIIDVPTDTALAIDPAGPSDSHALRCSHRVTTLSSHLCDFHCFSSFASLQEP